MGNGSDSVWQSITVAAPTETSVTGNIYVPKTPEVFMHDVDGNLTQDGRSNYTWNAENRLMRVESVLTTPQASHRRVEWKRDWQGRRFLRSLRAPVLADLNLQFKERARLCRWLIGRCAAPAPDRRGRLPGGSDPPPGRCLPGTRLGLRVAQGPHGARLPDALSR